MENYSIEYKDYNVYMTPKEGKYTYVIIFLHGLGDIAKSYIDFFVNTEVLPVGIPIKIVLAQSPYSKVFFDRPMGTSWFTISEFPLVSKECYNFSEAEKSSKQIEKMINEEAKLLDGKYENIYVGGFSQGACLSLLIGLTFEHPIGGVISLSGYLFSEIKIREKKKKINIFVGHGEKDNVISFLPSQEEMKRLKDFKGFVSYSYPNAKHTITIGEINDLNKFLTDCMK